MAIEIKLPDLGDGIESGDILDVLVNEGDEIAVDQGIVELETDKATVEVPSSHAGRVSSIHVASGQTIMVGQPLITLEPADAAAHAAPSLSAAQPPAPKPETAAKPAAPAAEPVAATTPATPPLEAAMNVERPPVARRPAPSQPMLAPADTTPSTPSLAAGLIPAGPAIRRFAREVGVDLASVQGTGPAGRITREDVLEVVRRANRAAKSRGVGTAARPEIEVPGTPANDSWGPISIETTSRIRKTIAKQMAASWSTVPRVTNFDDADVTELEHIRQASKADYAAKGIKLTTMPFIIKSVSMALRNHPLLNASLDIENGQVVYKRYINVGIAVDAERGLVVPALRNTDQKTIADIAKELASLATRVRNNSFTIDDLRGGTFSISNLGAIGGTYSTPIVNFPEVAILLVGRSRKMPVVVDDEIAIRLMMPLSISYDHRLVDGAAATRFLNEVISYLQAPGRLLLAP